MYTIKIHQAVKKTLLKYPIQVRRDFEKVVEAFRQNPFTPYIKIKKLEKPLIGYRYKMHPYRIAYTVNTETKTIYIYDFFHRGRGYR